MLTTWQKAKLAAGAALTLGLVLVGPEAGAQSRSATQLARAVALEAKGDVAQAAMAYKEILRTDPNAVVALNNLAWLQATSKEPSVYNPGEAIRNAARLVDITHYKERSTMGPWSKAFRIQNIYVLTVAFVAAGNQEQTVVHAQQMLELATRYDALTKSKESGDLLAAAKNVHAAALATGPGATKALQNLLEENASACEVSEIQAAQVTSPGAWEQLYFQTAPPLKVGATQFARLDVAARR
jgi:tetratricopeptide (TPR) repeat protein